MNCNDCQNYSPLEKPRVFKQGYTIYGYCFKDPGFNDKGYPVYIPETGGNYGIHQKLVNRMGAVGGIERIGGMSGDIENYSLRFSDSGTCAFGNCTVWHV